jgi:nucleoside-diphosphate-sugar epimerase
LVEAGWEVHAIRRPESKGDGLAGLKGVEIHVYDGSIESLDVALQQGRPDVVYHLASLVMAQHVPQQVGPLIASNILLGTQLLEAMVARKVYRLVNTGTYWQHYDDREYSPVSLYAATKQAFETIMAYYLETSPLVAATLCLFDVYGPEDMRPKLFHVLRQAWRNGAELAMSPGEQLMDLTYIDDVVDAYFQATACISAAGCEKNAVYSVSSGAQVSLREVVATYSRIVRREVAVCWGKRSYRTREVMVPWTKGKLVPGWRPRVSLEEGIARMEAAEEAVEV